MLQFVAKYGQMVIFEFYNQENFFRYIDAFMTRGKIIFFHRGKSELYMEVSISVS